MRITVLDGHPDRAPERLCHALAEAYAAGARETDHDVRLVRLCDLDFPVLETRADWESPATPAEVQEVQDAIAWCQHLVIVHPLWLGAAPARLKALLEQILRPQFAFKPGTMPVGRLKGRSVRLVVTMAMPALLFSTWFRAHGVRAMERSILAFVGLGPVRRTLLGGVEAASDEQRLRWLRRMESLGRRGR